MGPSEEEAPGTPGAWNTPDLALADLEVTPKTHNWFSLKCHGLISKLTFASWVFTIVLSRKCQSSSVMPQRGGQLWARGTLGDRGAVPCVSPQLRPEPVLQPLALVVVCAGTLPDFQMASTIAVRAACPAPGHPQAAPELVPPKPQVWFDSKPPAWLPRSRSRDDRFIFLDATGWRPSPGKAGTCPFRSMTK